MNTALSDQIAGLAGLNKAELRSIWAKNFREAPPASLRKDLMVPILAYRIQEREYGGTAVWRTQPGKSYERSPSPLSRASRPRGGVPRASTMARVSSGRGRTKSTRSKSQTAPLPIAVSRTAICPRSRERLPGHVGPAPFSLERSRGENEHITWHSLCHIHP